MSDRRKVLLVDDETEIERLVSLCLAPLGIEVVCVATLDEAIAASHASEIGLVLLDIALGDRDGLEMLPSLRAEERLAGIPIVAFTAHDSRRREALRLGVDYFLARPFLTGELQSTVDLHFVR